jgi:hypothetical protein
MTTEQKELAKENRQLDAAGVIEALTLILPAALPFARIVGAWVWVVFTEKPDEVTRGTLCELGFIWNKKRGAWQHSGGTWKTRYARGYDPRQKYGERVVTNENA